MNRWMAAGFLVGALAACDGPNNPEGNETVAGVPTAPATNAQVQAPGTTPLIRTGDEFVQVASASDRFEIESSRLALQKAQSPDVKRFAQMMINAHTATTNELKTTAAKLNPPLTPKALFNAKQTADMEGLRGAPAGAGFDNAYLTAQVEGHQATLAAMRDYASGGEVTELKAIAAKTAPIVQQHLSQAQQLQASTTG